VPGEVRDWQHRALDRMYPIVILDGCHCRAIGPGGNGDAGEDPRRRQPDGEDRASVSPSVRDRWRGAVYIALGVTREGEREVPG
jgi:transposase-like protein